jgi:aconitate hydratase
VPPRGDTGDVGAVSIDPASERLQQLAPFPPWHGRDFEVPRAGGMCAHMERETGAPRSCTCALGGGLGGQDLPVLIRVRGKCTTDHISAAGPWLRYKGHLGNLAANTLIGATDADTGQINHVVNHLTGKVCVCPPLAVCSLTHHRHIVPAGDRARGGARVPACRAAVGHRG